MAEQNSKKEKTTKKVDWKKIRFYASLLLGFILGAAAKTWLSSKDDDNEVEMENLYVRIYPEDQEPEMRERILKQMEENKEMN